MLLVASIWYLVLTTLLTIVQSGLEKRMSRGVSRSGTGRRNVFGRNGGHA